MKAKFWAVLVIPAILTAMTVIFAGQSFAAEIGPLPKMKYNAKKAELGKRLFFDPRLSGDAALSCATCHIPSKGFSDGKALSDAYPGTKGFRNTPTLINTAHKKAWFHDGRIGTNLNDVTRDQITETIWMNMDMRIMQERLKQDPVYVKMFKEAGFGEPSNGAVRNAIPEYIKSLASKNVPFDRGSMSAAAKRGRKLFTGKAGCVRCHNGPLLSDGEAHNLGVPENMRIFQEPLRHVAFIAFSSWMGIQNFMNLRRDPGAMVRNNNPGDMGKFITPTLRELKQTAPYMHNGTFKTLADVVAFYNRGGGKDSNKDKALRPLRLSGKERSDLVAFLEALSGDPLTGPKYALQKKIDIKYKPIPDWWNAKN